MSTRSIQAKRRSSRFGCEGLEPRALLSTLGSAPPTAEVHALATSTPRYVAGRSPLLPYLPTTPQVTASTSTPSSGDLNPYGVAVVPANFPKSGLLQPGDTLVSNFNGPGGLQGTGTSIVRVTPGGTSTLFARAPVGTGLAAVGVLSRGFVVAGSVPSTDGTSATAGAGSLFFFDRKGQVVGQYTNAALLNGPWDLTVVDRGATASIFVSNVLSGSVTRVNVDVPSLGSTVVVRSVTEIASGYAHRGDPAAFELGPTGVAFDARNGTLYVASTADNAVYAVGNALGAKSSRGTGRVVYSDPAHLHGPLGLALAPNGDLIAANGDAVNPDPAQPSTLIEFTPRGRFVGQLQVSTSPGAAFGLSVTTRNRVTTLAAVDDALNQLDLFTV